MRSKNKTLLYCFSPAVMLATFGLELFLALWVLLKAKPSIIKNLGVVSLILLAVFQLAEFAVCGSYSEGLMQISSRIGYVAITFLPAIGVHLANRLAGQKNNWTTVASYLLAGGFAAYFGFAPASINSSICTGNYVIFNLEYSATLAYTVYYFGLLLGMIGSALYWSRTAKDKNRREPLLWLVAGALVFLLPTGLVYWFVPESQLGIPSIMCGFAVLYAIILTFKIIPLSEKIKHL